MMNPELRIYFAKQRLEKAWLSKVWTDKARAAAAEARARHHDAQGDAHHEILTQGGASNLHTKARLAHYNAALRFDQAAMAYEHADRNRLWGGEEGAGVTGRRGGVTRARAFGNKRYRQGEKYAAEATTHEFKIRGSADPRLFAQASASTATVSGS